jgi:cytochrome P450 family 4 subfamily B polypeptide 1
VGLEDLSKLKYITCFLREVMRMHTTIGIISRRLTKLMMIDGIEFPAKTYVNINLHALNNHPDVWPDHRVFRPGRFLVDNSPFMFVPFSAGPRNCTGQNFAMNEIKVLISRPVHWYRVELDPVHHVVEMPDLVMRAKYGITVTVTSR